ncbi:MAG: exodeoxyribonuclease VII large subunit [Candidatus Paceibacterota bacterium]|jgi:exodeoxyribonuclease VII large subunit|nr:exodeoxyribonuclease VII large subunit [bacterium]
MEEKTKPSFSREFLKNNIFTVSAYITILNGILNLCEVKIKGEVGEVKKSSAGHVYFSLKDKKDNSVLSCVIWNFDYRMCNVELEDGLEIIAFGSPDIYAPNGRISFKAKTIQLVGEGELKKAYDKLKKKLEDEGIFDDSRKRDIPFFPQKIGIITSRYGAVINDFLSNIGHYGFKIKLIDARVEGQEAIKDLLSAIKTMASQDIDVLVIMRGGGSLESFMAFNNEVLIREVVKFSVPVIAALGHDKDVPLLSLAADKMTSTPTAAAMLLNLNWDKAESRLTEYQSVLINYFSNILSENKTKVNSSFLKISNYFNEAINNYEMLELKTKNSIYNSFDNAFTYYKKELDIANRIITQNDPKRNLKLGYSIIRSDNKIIKSIKALKLNQELDLEMTDGNIKTEIKSIAPASSLVIPEKSGI